ncbi:MAG: hypothetical protein RJB39_385 [Candidatus Parcubacteria bacterium]|jgi:oligoendopeptidase F
MNKLKTAWDFSHMYKGIKDPKIEKDVQGYVRAYKTFTAKYKDKKFVNSVSGLAQAMKDWNTLHETTSPRALWYLYLEGRRDTGNTELQAETARLDDMFKKGYKEIIFFSSAVSNIESKKQAVFLKDKRLAPYRYALKVMFAKGKYKLSDAEERIMTEKATVAHGAWVKAMTKYQNAQKVKKGKKWISLSEALSSKAELPRAERRALHKTVMEKYKEISFLAEAELNAIVRNRIIDCDIRGYKTPYEPTVLSYQNDLKSIESLVAAVTASNPIAHKFYSLKAKILNKVEKTGEKKITMAEFATTVSTTEGQSKNVSFEEAAKIVKGALAEASPEFGDMFQTYLDNAQLDVFPKQGKQIGAFCWGMIGSDRTRVFLNYSGRLKDISTIAHEMGHAIHWDLAKVQPAMYQDFTISVAEVASTFFENILFDKLLETATADEKRDLMLNDIQGRINTIHAQIAYFQFEKKLHAAVREQGYVSKENIAKMFADCRRSYIGDAIEITEDDGYGYVYISHFRRFFYVYSYAYGQLIADALYTEYKKDKRFIEKVKKFLRAGGSMSPADIFKSIGIDTTKPDFFKKGLKKLSDDLEKVSKMVRLR